MFSSLLVVHSVDVLVLIFLITCVLHTPENEIHILFLFHTHHILCMIARAATKKYGNSLVICFSSIGLSLDITSLIVRIALRYICQKVEVSIWTIASRYLGLVIRHCHVYKNYDELFITCDVLFIITSMFIIVLSAFQKCTKPIKQD